MPIKWLNPLAVPCDKASPWPGHDLDTIRECDLMVAPRKFDQPWGWRIHPMLASARVGLFAALVTLVSFFASVSFGPVAAFAADKAFQRADLADAAIKLEAQIKNDAGSAAKPLAQLRRDADAAFQKNDVRNGVVLLGQIIAAAPNESATWLRLARATLLLWSPSDRERREMLERAATAAYIAYQRA